VSSTCAAHVTSIVLLGTSLACYCDRGLASETQEASRAAGLVRANGAADSPDSNAASRPEDEVQLEEIVVTANKRAAASINDIPMSITAVTAADIQQRGLAGMADYLPTLPSVSFVDLGYSSNTIIVRGLDTNPAGTTRPALVGTYFGETTLTGLVGLSTESNPDIKLVDIERIELLPGPQGTLYGDASMGGALRIIPVKPKMNILEARAAGSYSFMEHGSSGNYDIQGIVNLPLVQDKLALRVDAYRYYDDGFIKNVAGENPTELAAAALWGGSAPVTKVSDRKYTGGRAALRWDPTDALSITLTHLHQKTDQNGGSSILMGLGDGLQQANFGGEFASNEFGLTNLDLTYDFSWASFISSTAWVDASSAANSDLERFVGPLLGTGNVPIFQIYRHRDTGFTEEARLTSRLPGRLQWLTGVFYQDKRLGGNGGPDDWSFQVAWRGDPARDPFMGANLLQDTAKETTKQTAVFGELSYELVTNLTATAGVRYYNYRKEDHEISNGLLSGGASDTLIRNDDNGTTKRVNVSYHATPDALLFATYSEGFRLGGPHTLLPTTCLDTGGRVTGLGIAPPKEVLSDHTKNVELGSKLTLMNRKLQLDASVYNIDWQDIPVDVQLACGFPVTINAGRARSRGVELSGQLALSHFRANYTAAYTDARLTRDLPPAGLDGQRLPGSPRINGSIGLEYDFNLVGRNAFTRADLGYVGDYFRDLAQSAPRLGNYTTLGARAGVALGKLDVEVFAQNLTNKYALTWADSQGGATVLRPRTVGIRLGYDFNRR